MWIDENTLMYCTIIVLVVGYSQLVVSHISRLETLFSCVNKLGTDSSHPAKSCREIYNYNMASRGQSEYYWIKTDNILKVYWHGVDLWWDYRRLDENS